MQHDRLKASPAEPSATYHAESTRPDEQEAAEFGTCTCQRTRYFTLALPSDPTSMTVAWSYTEPPVDDRYSAVGTTTPDAWPSWSAAGSFQTGPPPSSAANQHHSSWESYSVLRSISFHRTESGTRQIFPRDLSFSADATCDDTCADGTRPTSWENLMAAFNVGATITPPLQPPSPAAASRDGTEVDVATAGPGGSSPTHQPDPAMAAANTQRGEACGGACAAPTTAPSPPAASMAAAGGVPSPAAGLLQQPQPLEHPPRHRHPRHRQQLHIIPQPHPRPHMLEVRGTTQSPGAPRVSRAVQCVPKRSRSQVVLRASGEPRTVSEVLFASTAHNAQFRAAAAPLPSTRPGARMVGFGIGWLQVKGNPTTGAYRSSSPAAKAAPAAGPDAAPAAPPAPAALPRAHPFPVPGPVMSAAAGEPRKRRKEETWAGAGTGTGTGGDPLAAAGHEEVERMLMRLGLPPQRRCGPRSPAPALPAPTGPEGSMGLDPLRTPEHPPPHLPKRHEHQQQGQHHKQQGQHHKQQLAPDGALFLHAGNRRLPPWLMLASAAAAGQHRAGGSVAGPRDSVAPAGAAAAPAPAAAPAGLQPQAAVQPVSVPQPMLRFVSALRLRGITCSSVAPGEGRERGGGEVGVLTGATAVAEAEPEGGAEGGCPGARWEMKVGGGGVEGGVGQEVGLVVWTEEGAGGWERALEEPESRLPVGWF